MIKALFYKEWVKTRGAFLGTLVVGIACILYIYTGIENKITLQGAKSVMLRILYDEPPYLFYAAFRYMPLLTALAIGLSQYIPEVLQKRIRLTLHLPLSNNRLILLMASYGLLLLTIGNLLYGGLFLYYNIRLFPTEITSPLMLSILPWVLAGYVAYNFIALIAMEPNRWNKLFYSLVGWNILQLFMVSGEPGAYAASIPVMTLLALLSSGFVLYSSRRFYKGER